MFNKVYFIAFWLVLVILTKTLANETVVIELQQRKLSGKVEKTFFNKQDYFSFKGIPYATPPIGKLRFKPPTPYEGWEGTYKAYENKPTCLQYSSRMRMGEPFGISGDEDCLYLSVFTPDLRGSKAVVVFDYSDNFRSGFNGTDTYSPLFFMEEDVIVVTINHRFGLMGYLSTEDEVIPGNNGIRDFILGLQWIKDNIEHFGGDPKRITLMGNRGGAILANILMYSEQAKDLFHGIIMQSGTAMESIIFGQDSKGLAFKLAQLVNITAEDSATLLEEFQKIDVYKLLAKEADAISNDLMENHQISSIPLSPIIEKESQSAVLSSFPMSSKIINDVPVLLGFNSREGLDLASHYIFEPRLITDLGQDFFFQFPIRSGFRFDRKSSVFEEAIKEIKDFYFEDGYLHYNNILEYAVYVGDVLQDFAINYAARKLTTELQSNVFYYMFDFCGLLNENTLYISNHARSTTENWGATITDEICYLHMCSRISKNYEDLNKLISEQPEIKVLKKMVRMWTNFAKTGNPTPSAEDKLLKGFIWNPVDKKDNDLNYLHINKGLRMKKNPLGEREHFWDQFLRKYSQMAINGLVQPASELREDL
ncbi:juvenile hormone esterase-like [Galleria mellonella]|uniref:Juvenile hormone esterase-like n=1 Tax=Galleria mellonella TaxID=7137 RepID=A0A6J3C1S9_GALME|nr:juvenile hormone esterase-like [Galleria mellonella]